MFLQMSVKSQKKTKISNLLRIFDTQLFTLLKDELARK